MPGEQTNDEPYRLECPHCHAEWIIDEGDELCYANDVADEITSKCDECGGEYTIRTQCFVYFHVTPSLKDRLTDGSNERHDDLEEVSRV